MKLFKKSPPETGTQKVFDKGGKIKIPDPHLPAKLPPAESTTTVEPIEEAPAPKRKSKLGGHNFALVEVCDHSKVREAHAALVAAREELAKVCAIVEDTLYPDAELRKISQAIAVEADPAKLTVWRQKAAELSGPAAAVARGRARSIRAGAAEKCKARVVVLLDTAERVAKEILARTIAEETAFLLRYDLDHEHSEASLSVIKSCLRPIASFRDGLESKSGHPLPITKNSFKSVCDFFATKTP